MQAAKVNITDEDNSSQVIDAILGISGVSGITQRGPINDPSIIISSEEEFKRIFGGLMTTSEFPLQCVRALKRGGQLRVNRIVHYTTITDAATSTAVVATASKQVNDGAGVPLNIFGITPKYAGAAYNQLKVDIKLPTNGLPEQGYFDMDIYLADDKSITLEPYQNLKVNANVGVEELNFLEVPMADSKLVDFNYVDLSARGATIQVPKKETITFSGGTDGGVVVPVDYIGSPVSRTGFYAFDEFDDMMQVAVPTIYDSAVNQAGAEYADGRKDLEFFAHLNHNLKTVDALIAARAAVTLNTRYIAFFTGGVKIKHPVTNKDIEISEMGDILGIAAYVDAKFGPWYALSNYVRGFVPGAISVATNFGSPGRYTDLNKLAQRQINTVVAADGKVYLSGNFTGQFTESKASFLNVTRLIIWLRKTLRPILTKYLEEPTDLETFKKIFQEVEPIFESLKETKRALYNYDWQGDQDADNINNVRINNLADLDKGKYKVRLRLEPIVGLGNIDVAIILERTGSISIELEQTV